MQAIRITAFTPDPGSLQPTRVAVPSPRSADEYLIRITHCSPQHADLLHAQGRHQNNNAKHGWCHPPFTLGFDFAGEVVRRGGPPTTSSEDAFQPGDRVFGQHIGSFAEYLCVPGERMRKVPEGLSAETACAMAGQAVSYAAVMHVASVQAGETVLVSGATGGLGSVCCMVAKAIGAQVIALAGSEEKATALRRDTGIDLAVVVDGKGAWMGEVMRFTKGRGVEVCLDNTGMVNEALRVLAYKGRVVVLGFAAREGVMEEVKMNKVLLKSAAVMGYRFGESARRFPDELERIWEGYLEMLQSGRLKALIYGKYVGLTDMGRALRDLADRKVYGKIVVRVAEESRVSRL